MAERIYNELFDQQHALRKHTCVGLDTNDEVVQQMVEGGLELEGDTPGELVVAYNTMVLEETADIAGIYKPNLQFYLGLGYEAITTLKQTFQKAHSIAPEVPIVLDAKFQDIDSTNNGSMKLLKFLEADGATLHVYLGSQASSPFLDVKNMGFFALDRTSNPGAGEFQDLWVATNQGEPATKKLYEVAAEIIHEKWNRNGNCGLVAGATYPDEAGIIRNIVGSDLMVLFPGVGTQGGTAPEIVLQALRRGQKGVVNASRSTIFAARLEGETQRQAIRRAAFKLHDEIFDTQEQLAA
mgnify:CR=1 FL=1